MSYVVATPSNNSFSIPELPTDPVSPAVNSAWVLRTTTHAGSPIGLLLAITNAVSSTSYKLSYKTISGTIVRVALT